MEPSSQFTWFFQGRENEPRDRLTFGVELEFALAAIPRDQNYDPDEGDPRAGRGIDMGVDPDQIWLNSRHHIVNTLRKAGISAEASLHEYLTSTSWKPDDPQAWGVKEDNTIKAEGRGYSYIATEIVSPAFYFSLEALQEVKYVCTLLSNTYRLACNNTCALHVHVGNAKKGLGYETAQKLMATYFTFEPQLEQIHPPHRRDNPNCPKVRKSAMMITKIRGKFRTVREGLARIFKGHKNTMEELFEDTSPAERGKYNEKRRSALTIGELLSYDDKKTVEFRQHEMTLSPTRVENWIRLCVGLVEFSDTVDRKILKEFLETLMDKLTLKELLENIGLPREAEYYSQRLVKNK